ncbi:hexadecenal dehydrogenase [Saccharomyces paradoxus]|uniref:Aldehyde dehydrogenase n=1 Tax=Saccharomyces paradoxus TaxID=27291 RepID=A0A8B8UXG0_SACPA|nr:Hfd1 [Saccharomyces paradoxus]QHS75381.1 Hfd1 [Saccharomyces paradoxus]
MSNSGSKILNYTPVSKIDEKIETSRNFFFEKQLKLSHESNPRKKDLEFRELQLKKLYYAVKDHEEELIDAMYKDFHRTKVESVLNETTKLMNDILHLIEILPKMMKTRKVSDSSPPFMFGKTVVEKISRGSVLIIAPFNFPLLLALGPLAAALAAGNTIVLKPSELTPHTAVVIENMLATAGFPSGLIQVVQGAIDETTRLLDCGKFDLIFYTGSPRVGSVVAEKAAKSLTPCVLELGGKSPTFITGNFKAKNIKTALKRIFFGAFGNSGQICVSPDYLLVHKSIYPKVIEECKTVLNEFYPDFDEHTDYTRMIHEAACKKTVGNINSTNGSKIVPSKISIGPDAEDLCLVPPTVVYNIDWDDPLMRQENFAPVLPIIEYDDLDETISKIIKEHDTPLVQYIFSDSQTEIDRILTRLRSGGCVVDDTVIHVGITDAPFGGIGNSGYGNYGGFHGFNTFSHERTIFKQPYWNDFTLFMRYPPNNTQKEKLIRFAMERKPWFDRKGNNKWGLRQYFSLSAAVILISTIYAHFSS